MTRSFRLVRPMLLAAVAAAAVLPTRSTVEAAPGAAPLDSAEMSQVRGGNEPVYRYYICTPRLSWVGIQSYCLYWDD